VSADPAVVERVLEDAADAVCLEPGLAGQLVGAYAAERVALEQADGDADCRGIDLERVRGPGRPAKAEGRVATQVASQELAVAALAAGIAAGTATTGVLSLAVGIAVFLGGTTLAWRIARGYRDLDRRG
jgi:hypothetical protein